MTRHRLFTLGCVALTIGGALTVSMRAGDNLDFENGGQIRDSFWDSRLFDGTPGFSGAILWFHNPANKPGSLSQAAFEAAVEAGFNTWEGVDDGIAEAPIVPVVNFGGQTTATDPFALDGINTMAWQAEAPGGTLAVTPCWILTEPTTTIDDGTGKAAMPVSGGAPIPFPGPVGVTYPVGTNIDCGMRFDSLDTWSTSQTPSLSGFDVQSVGTHEAGHFLGLSHSTLGDFTAANAISATMLPFAAPGDATFRTLEEDDKASALRIYARNRSTGPLPQTIGGRATLHLTLLKGASCTPATGVSVVAYRTQSGIDGPHRVESFSGSHLRAGIGDEPVNGSVTLNVAPLSAGESYTVYARTLEQGLGALSAQRYNFTTISSNLVDPEGQSRTFDQLATVDALSAGQSIDLGDLGILGCWVPNPASPVNLVAESIVAPEAAFKGSQIAVSSVLSNRGTAAAGSFEAGVYFSTDQTITSSDIFSGFTCQIPGLQPGGVASCDGAVPVPGAVVPGDYYVGLLADIQNQIAESAEIDNGVAAASPTTVSPNPLDPIVNGSFETGDLTGWTVKELTPASNPSLPLSVHGAGVQYPADQFIAWPYILDYFASAPTDGQWAALHDFNGDDPATSGGPSQFVNRRELYQDVTLPAGTTTLEFDYRAAWELFRFGSTLDRTFSLAIEPFGGGAPLLTQTVLVAPNLTIEEDTDNPTGGVGDYPPGRVDLSAFAGQSVRLKFVWNIPEPGTGFGFFQLDNIRLNTLPNAPPTVTVTSPADGSVSISGQSVSFVATAVDAEDGDISGSLSWSSDRDGALGTGATLSTTALSIGSHTITASVADSIGLPGSDSITISVAPGAANSPPSVTITAPDDGATLSEGGSMSFAGTATDAEDGNISANISWASDLDGALGSGATISTMLTGGRHTITASVTDAGGLTVSAAIIVNVTAINRATADVSTTRGTITAGTFEDTWLDDDTYQVLTEAVQGGNPARRRSLLEHTWAFDVIGGAQYTFKVNAYRSGTEDNFTFAYSRNTVTYTPMVTVSGSADDDTEQTYVFPEDVRGTVYIRVQDTDSTQGHAQADSLFVDFLAITTLFGGGVTAPVVTITTPADGASFPAGAAISFGGTATDAEEGDLAANLVWTSSIDGAIGSGQAVSISTLTPGSHTIVASVTDGSGLNATDSIAITVVGEDGVTLAATGYKIKGLQHADLAWSGATTSLVAIARDGTVVATVANPGIAGGTYTDNIGSKGGGTHTYQVCETGGGACSQLVTVAF